MAEEKKEPAAAPTAMTKAKPATPLAIPGFELKLPLIESKDYLMFAVTAEQLDGAREAFKGLSFQMGDLEKISLPSGKGKPEWAISSAAGDVYAEKIQGIMLDIREWRTWYRIPYEESGGGSPPDCSSDDATVGFGDRTMEGNSQDLGPHDCLTCPWAQFKSTRKGGPGQDCSEKRAIFLYRIGAPTIIPSLMMLPPTSIRPVKQMHLGIIGGFRPLESVEVEFSIIRDKSEGGVEFSKVAMKMIRKTTPEQAARVAALKSSMTRIKARAAHVTQDLTSEEAA